MPEVLEGHALVTTVLFAWARHPMYAVFLYVPLSVYLATLSPVLALTFLFVLVLTLICTNRIPEEEGILVGLFGDEYREYRQSVPGASRQCQHSPFPPPSP